jgi:hypothetical protein
VFIVSLASLLFAVPASSDAPFDTDSHPGKLDAALRKQARSDPGEERTRVIVTKEHGQALDSVVQAVRAVRGDVKQTLPNVGAVVADLPANKLLKLTSSRSVRAISVDAPLQPVDGNVVQPPTAPTPGAETLRDVLGLPPINPAAAGVGVPMSISRHALRPSTTSPPAASPPRRSIPTVMGRTSPASSRAAGLTRARRDTAAWPRRPA